MALSFGGGPPRGGGPSASTGRQTARKRKSGARNEGAFKRLLEAEGLDPASEGSSSGSHRLDGGLVLTSAEKAALSSARAKGQVKGSKRQAAVVDAALGTYKKRAGTRSAAELRAEAAEKRVADTQPAAGLKVEDGLSDAFDEDGFDSDDDDDELYEPIPETDAARRQALVEAEANDGVSDDDDDAWATYEREIAQQRSERAVRQNSSLSLTAGVAAASVKGKGRATSALVEPKPEPVDEPLFFLDGASESSDSDIEFVRLLLMRWLSSPAIGADNLSFLRCQVGESQASSKAIKGKSAVQPIGTGKAPVGSSTQGQPKTVAAPAPTKAEPAARFVTHSPPPLHRANVD
jgi:hypothetical protein